MYCMTEADKERLNRLYYEYTPLELYENLRSRARYGQVFAVCMWERGHVQEMMEDFYDEVDPQRVDDFIDAFSEDFADDVFQYGLDLISERS